MEEQQGTARVCENSSEYFPPVITPANPITGPRAQHRNHDCDARLFRRPVAAKPASPGRLTADAVESDGLHRASASRTAAGRGNAPYHAPGVGLITSLLPEHGRFQTRTRVRTSDVTRPAEGAIQKSRRQGRQRPSGGREAKREKATTIEWQPGAPVSLEWIGPHGEAGQSGHVTDHRQE